MVSGGCQCGAIRYDVDGAPEHSALCYCTDCRKSSGAPMVGWALFARSGVRIEGEPVIHASSADARRHFCGTCGSSLFYTNEAAFPGMIDITTGSLDDPDVCPPAAHIQWADAPHWMARLDSLPRFDRFPG
ncbi:MAG: GFA family protein [Sphingomonadales bacterium]|nr:MAG: GFA family protein [Sphingomonadales bacterium]TNF01772.1 MAG: GFA family protein [Sphingomonadales bacterium]